jgi:hypothetical protein
MSKSSSSAIRVLIKLAEKHYKYGTVMIQSKDGSILYAPAGRVRVTMLDAQGIPIPRRLINEEVDHFSFHGSGLILVKLKNSTRTHERVEQRDKVTITGYQNLLLDQVLSIKDLPEYTKQVKKEDHVIEVKEDQSLEFCLNIISGKLVVQAMEQGRYTTEKREEESLKTFHIGIGETSGNGDKLLQFIFTPKKKHDLPKISKRYIVLPYNEEIRIDTQVKVVHKMK